MIIIISLLILAFPLYVFADDHKPVNSTNLETEQIVEVATFDVTDGFEQEVNLENMTTIEWTLTKRDASYLLTLDLPGKQLPASGWKEFYNDLGLDIAKKNKMELVFSDGTKETLYIDVIGNSGKVRFWIEADENTDPQHERNDVEGNNTFNIIIPKKDGKTLSRNVELRIEWINKQETTFRGTWFIWLNNNDKPLISTNMTYTLKNLPPGTHHVKVELRDHDGKTVSETEEVFNVPTDNGGTLPKTATPWPNFIIFGAILMGLGAIARGILHALPIK
jgi:hypothetical protein